MPRIWHTYFTWVIIMRGVEEMWDFATYILQSPTNRHIVGGALISVSLLFCGLAITVMTLDISGTS